jgi:hypothetical protein
MFIVIGCSTGGLKQSPIAGTAFEDPCYAWARSMAPASLRVVPTGEGEYMMMDQPITPKGAATIPINHWADGTVIPPDAYFSVGKNTGENVHYLYYRPNPLRPEDMRYEKQVLSKDGTILGTNRFTAKLVLDPAADLAKAPPLDPMAQARTGDFAVKGVEITSCDFVQKEDSPLNQSINE